MAHQWEVADFDRAVTRSRRGCGVDVVARLGRVVALDVVLSRS